MNFNSRSTLTTTLSTAAAPDSGRTELEEFYEFLMQSPTLSAEQKQAVVQFELQTPASSYRTLCEKCRLDPKLFANLVAEFHDLPRADLTELMAGQALAKRFSMRYLREAGIFPYEAKGGRVRIATTDPGNQNALRVIMLALPGEPQIEVAAFDEIEIALRNALDETVAAEAHHGETGGGEAPEDIQELLDLASGAPVVQAVESMIERAVEMGATDIHIEPFRNQLQVRLRIDGVLRPIAGPKVNQARAVISRIKIMANLNIAEHRLPQDGRARVRLNGREFDIRIATMPTIHGESSILRLLEHNDQLLDLPQLGLSARDLAALERQLLSPYGLIIVTGPTGSGKTTTLASALTRLNDTTRKILTIEDPIEYNINGVCQSQIKPAIGLTFATALRAFLRQDPDVIMVGEMRDSETAKIGIQASLTGHLVLTTLHTNTAAAAITRLTDMGIEPFLLASTLRCMLAQRLVRILCPHCRRRITVDAALLQRTPRIKALGVTIGATLYEAVGCERCNGTGYRGRRAVFEVLEVSEPIRRLVATKASDAEIERLARAEGMTTMIEDGLRLCLDGTTTVDEVFRISVSR